MFTRIVDLVYELPHPGLLRASGLPLRFAVQNGGNLGSKSVNDREGACKVEELGETTEGAQG